jgi:hypothetical protein
VYASLYGVRWEELFHAPPDCTPQRAKGLRAEWEADVETRIATLRAKQRGDGHDLTQKQAHALAGEWYRWFTAPYEDNPGSLNINSRAGFAGTAPAIRVKSQPRSGGVFGLVRPQSMTIPILLFCSCSGKDCSRSGKNFCTGVAAFER